jgi:four helix bundle protein
MGNFQKLRVWQLAKGSAAELMTQLIIANEIGYVDIDTRNILVDECDKISSMLAKLIKARCQST